MHCFDLSGWTPKRVAEHRQETECELIWQHVDRAIQSCLRGYGVTIHPQRQGPNRAGAREAREDDAVVASVLLSLGFDVYYEGNPSNYGWDMRYIRVPGENPHITEVQKDRP